MTRWQFLDISERFLGNMTNGLRRFTTTTDTPDICRDSAAEAIELLRRARTHLAHAARYADRCDLSEDSECDDPCRGPVNALLLHTDPETYCAACVVHAGYGLYFLDDVEITGDAELVNEAKAIALELTYKLRS